MGKIKIVVVDGLNADDVLKLKQGGFFDGVSVPLPQGAVGQEAVLALPPKLLGDKLDPKELSNTSETMQPVKAPPSVGGYDANVRDAVEQAEAKQEAKVARRKKEKEEDRAVERAANAADEQPVEAATTAEQQESSLPEPKGNGKKYAAKHARKGGRYIVMAFSRKWEAVFEGPSKAGLKFTLVHKADPNVISVDEGALVEEIDVAAAAQPDDEQALDTSDVDLSIDTLLTFTKLRDLIQYIVDSGIPSSGVAAFCESMKAEVPLLQRISNIEERVGRTLEVMGLSAGE